MRTVGAYVVSALIAFNSASATESAAEEGKRLDGTVLQLLAVHGDWSPNRWSELFRAFHALRLSQIVIQWTVYDDMAFYPSRRFTPVALPPLKTILDLAHEHGIRVLVGLAHDSGYWERVAREPDSIEPYLKSLQERSVWIARELAPLVGSHPAFEGWYISEEIDDINWREPVRRKMLYEHLRVLSTKLHRFSSRARIAVSGFSNAATDPVAFEHFWAALLDEAPAIDVVFFQDGIGVQKLALDELPIYFGAMKQAVEARSRELRAIIEVFRQTAGPPVNEGEFRAEPAILDRIRQQIRIASAFSSKLVAFSVLDYLSPLGGEAPGALFDQYRQGCIVQAC